MNIQVADSSCIVLKNDAPIRFGRLDFVYWLSHPPAIGYTHMTSTQFPLCMCSRTGNPIHNTNPTPSVFFLLEGTANISSPCMHVSTYCFCSTSRDSRCNVLVFVRIYQGCRARGTSIVILDPPSINSPSCEVYPQNNMLHLISYTLYNTKLPFFKESTFN